METNSKMQVPLVLNGNNYLTWARTTKIFLGGKGYISHLEPTEEEKAASMKAKEATKALTPEEKKWVQEDLLVLGVLQSSLELTILEGYSYCETAMELWDTLKQVYGDVSNFTKVFEIKRALTELHQGDMEFKAFFGKFRCLWAELDMLRPTTTDAKIINERKEQDKVFGLLMALSPAYTNLIQHILRQEKLPSLEEVCSRVQKEQASLGLFSKEALPIANKVIITEDKGENSQVFCEHCKKPGHMKNKCWILHPHLKKNNYHPNYNNHGRSNYNRSTFKSYPRANHATEFNNGHPNQEETHGESVTMKKADLEALFKSISNSGTSLFSNVSSTEIIVDSGASHHMVNNSQMLDRISPSLYKNVVLPNGDRIPIKGTGNLELFGKKSSALYIPKFKTNLLSVKKATKDLNCLAIFSPNDVKFQDIKSSKVLGQGGTKDDMYILKDFSSLPNSVSAFHVFNNEATMNVLWHARLGHPHARALELLIPSISFDNSRCEACILGKHCKVVFPHSKTVYKNCFDLVHSDVWTSPCVSRDNHKYFVTFIDERSKYTWLTLIPSKDRVFEAFQNFQNYITNHYNAKIKIFRTDNGGEYMGNAFQSHLSKHGILHQTSCPYTPQQNGVAERKNRHLMEVARSMMFYHNVPKRYWGDAVMTSCYLINRTPTKMLGDVSPFEVLNKEKPFINHLRVFGCVCFVLQQGSKDKLDARSIKTMFLGYSSTQKGYKCFDPSTNKMYVSREVKFFEEQSFHGKKNWEEVKDLTTSPTDQASYLRKLLDQLGIQNLPNQGGAPMAAQEATSDEEAATDDEEIPSQDAAREVQNIARNTQNAALNEQGESSIPNIDLDTDVIAAVEGEEDVQDREEEDHTSPVLRRSTRLRSHPDTWINKRVYYNAHAVAHPIQAVCSLDLLPTEHRAFMSKIEAHCVPGSYEEALTDARWTMAVDDEIGAMVKNHTWDEEELPKGKRCVSSKWVFTIKYKADGEVERYKARLVARGFTQTYGDDYTETFAPVAKQHTVKVVLSIAVNLDWELWQMDVKNAFLQGDLEEEVYMTPPPGLQDTIAQGKVLRLRKAIYGLKQSPRAWYHKLSTTLMANGFQKSHSDHTLFTLQNENGIVVVLVYVDDLIISGSNKEGIKSIKTALHSAFDIKDLGELKYFLGIEVCRSPEGLFLSQRKYTLDLLALTGKLGAKAAKTPLEAGYKVNRKGEKDDTPYKDPNQYRCLVGKLIYLTYTRPDISFAVNQVSQHMKEPTVYHWSLVERILRYLKGSPGQGIWMGRNNNTEIVGYCDADWSGDRVDRKSTTGYCTFIGGNLVTWKTKKQKVVSGSSAEAEYRAMRKLTDELVWLKALTEDLGVKTTTPMTMHCDNQAAIHIATNSVFHERTKHIEIDCHKVRERIENGAVLPCYTRSEDQLADIFTKAASLKVCDHIHSKLGLVDLTKP